MEFADNLPPKPPHKLNLWDGLVEELEANPGMWGKCRTYKSHQSAINTKNSMLKKQYPHIEWEVRDATIYGRA